MANNYAYSDGATSPIYSNVYPASAYDPNTNKLWVSWEAWNGSIRQFKIRVYNFTTRTWGSEYTVGTSPLTDDDHGVPAIVRDADGYWHLFGGAHINQTSGLRHFVTNSPDDPSAWTGQTVINPDSAGISYPHPVLIGSVLFLYFRYGDYGNNVQTPLAYIKSTSISSGSVTWGTKTILADYGGTNRYYQGQTHLRNGTEVHFVSTRADKIDSTRTDVHYLIHETSDDSVKNATKSFSTASGSLPVANSSLNTNYRIYTQVGDCNDIPQLEFDADGVPHVTYLDGTIGAGAFTVYHTALFSGSWSSPATIGTGNNRNTDYCITQSGDGGVDVWWTSINAGFTNGGDVSTAHRTHGVGGSWGSGSVFYDATGKFAIDDLQAVHNGIPAARLYFTEVHQSALDSGAGSLKGFIYGDTGYLQDGGSVTTIALVAHGICTDTNNSTNTIPSVDTTGANFIAIIAAYQQGVAVTLSDNKSNTWTGRTVQSNTGDVEARLFYCANPTVGTGHTFTLAGTNAFPAIAMAAFSGVASSPADVQTGNKAASGAGTIATGSITPTQNGDLVITGGGFGHVPTGVSSFTVTDLSVSGAHIWPVGMAYKIQTTAGAENETWTLNSSGSAAVVIDSFKVASAAPARRKRNTLMMAAG